LYTVTDSEEQCGLLRHPVGYSDCVNDIRGFAVVARRPGGTLLIVSETPLHRGWVKGAVAVQVRPNCSFSRVTLRPVATTSPVVVSVHV